MATKIIVTCDRCGKEIVGEHFGRETEWGDFDFCDQCSSAFNKWEQEYMLYSEIQFRKWLDVAKTGACL